MTDTSFAIEVKNLRFQWKSDQPILDIPSLVLTRGSHTFLKGSSGSGKSTLLSILAGIIKPDQGEVFIQGADFLSLSPSKKDQFRSEHMGIIFQMFNLLPFLSVSDNICLPCRFSSARKQKAIQKFGSLEEEGKHLLSALGMAPSNVWDRAVGELSVGQQQRVAAARALIGAPDLIIADEPTSALDTDNRDSFINLLSQQAKEHDTTLLFVSHDENLAGHFDKIIHLEEINQIQKLGVEA
ncbi:ABC transporter ATP-binding protein [Hirschia litorea]|uniref:ABC transporter ATP-binding protein n=1 Tax=Hirschia litorea TaxID=1199156 RepID=A0ABW2IHC0_9PROT